jgi:threonine synthase
MFSRVVDVIEVLVVEFSAFNRLAAAAETVTVVVAVPTCSFTSATAIWSIRSAMGPIEVVSKPEAVAVTA